MIGEMQKMLGEQIEDEKGKITSERVLSADGETEVSFSASGKVRGIQVTDIGTFMTTQRPGGTLFGQGNGVITSRDGESATYSGTGIGRIQDGKVSWRGAVYFQTASSGKLASLNNTVGVYELEADTEGNLTNRSWEWK
jgi:hypothetical protein